MAEDPDKSLVLRSKAGDQHAFGKLVTHYYQMVYGLAFGVLNHREKARDVAQEVFLKVFRQLPGFQEQSKFKTWLYRIAVNAAIDEQRKNRPTVSLDSTDESSDEDRAPVVLEDKGPSPRELAGQSELKEHLKRALEKLSADHRAVLTLREWQGMAYEEIADILGVEIGTVMSRLFYARKKLKEILELEIKRKHDAGQ